LLFRYRARNFPTSLSDEESQLADWCQHKLQDGVGGRSLAQFQREMAAVRERELTPAQQDILQQLDSYAASLLTPQP
jgi:exodeoxyribonuclease-1